MRHDEDFQKSEAPKVPESVKADLLRIGGTNDYGEPKLQLVWGETCLWFRAGKERLKYPIARKLRRLAAWNIVHIATGKKSNLPPGPEPVMPVGYLVSPVWEDREIGYKGWILEEWWPPEVVCPGWENQRWFEKRNAFGKVVEKIDLLGPAPTRGDFRFLMYLEIEEEGGLIQPLEVTDHRLIEIVECAFKLRQDQGAADGWRTIQSPEKAREMQRLIQQDRDKTTAEEQAELEDMIRDSVAGYARKLRHAYLS